MFSFTKSKEDSEDLAQQTFLKVWQQLETFRGDSSFLWVYRIAINLAKNFVVSSSYKKQRSNIPMEDLNIDFSSFDSVEEIIIHDESMSKISNFVNTLPESLKTAFTLRESEGKSYEEISVITNTPIGTVRSRIFRARELIIEYMKKELMNHE